MSSRRPCSRLRCKCSGARSQKPTYITYSPMAAVTDTRESAAMEKENTTTTLKKSVLNPNAPRIRTYEDLTRKFEQTFDAIESGRLERPKQIDGMLTALKAIKNLGIDLPMRWM